MKHKAMHSQPATVVGAGFFAYDVLLGASNRYEALGGSAGNVLAILAYLGWRSVPVATLGADPAAERIRAEFANLGALTGFLRTSVDAKTPVIYQTLSEGKPSYSFSCPACGALTRKSPNSAHRTLADEVRSLGPVPSVFYFDRASEETAAIAEHFRSKGTFVVFEPSKREDTAAFRACLGLSHVIKYAADRIESFSENSGDFIEVCTDGSAGLRFRMPMASRWTLLPSIQAPYVRDTSGAGDWCTAGAIYWFMRTSTDRARVSSGQVREALRFGQALAALNCMHEGARALATRVSAKKLVGLGETIAQHASVRKGIDEADEAFRPDHGTWRAAHLSQLCCGKLSI